jgi:hypothetical protein
MSTLHAAASGAHNRSQAVAAQLLSGLAELDLITFVCFQIDFGVVGQTANQPRGAVFRFTLPQSMKAQTFPVQHVFRRYLHRRALRARRTSGFKVSESVT